MWEFCKFLKNDPISIGLVCLICVFVLFAMSSIPLGEHKWKPVEVISATEKENAIILKYHYCENSDVIYYGKVCNQFYGGDYTLSVLYTFFPFFQR